MPIRIADICAGIGGIRLGVEQAAADLSATTETVAAIENDPNATKVYAANYGQDALADITDPTVKATIPAHDLLLAGFPCQAFSCAGDRKGFEDARGTIFFHIAEVLDRCRPEALLLENVAGLTTHDEGQTFKIIIGILKDLGYRTTWKVLDAVTLVPQHRKRVYIIGQQTGVPTIPDIPPGPEKGIWEILHDYRPGEATPENLAPISEEAWHGHQKRKTVERKIQAGFGYTMTAHDQPSRTLIASNPWQRLVWSNGAARPQVFTPREWARLQGFPDTFQLAEAKTRAWKQLGNSVAVPVIRHVARPLIAHLAQTTWRPECLFCAEVAT